MKLAICNETFRNWSFNETFRYASQLGYDGIEIAPFTIRKSAFDIADEQCSEIAGIANRYALEIVGLHWLLAFTDGYHVTSPDQATRERTADYLARLASVCRLLGGSIMVLGSPAQRNILPDCSVEQANDYAVDCITRSIPALADNNVVLALEPLGPAEGNFMLTADWAVDLIDRIGSPHVKLHLDVKAMTTESIPIENIIRNCRSHLAHFHANDPNLRGPGMGDVAYEPIIRALRDIGYDGWLSVEVFDESVDPETIATESIKYLKDQLA